MRKINITSLYFKFALGVTCLLILIEGILLVFSINSKRRELHKFNQVVSQSLEYKYKIADVKIYSANFIENQMKIYSKNIILLTVVIILFVVVGFLFIYHFLIGNKINQILKFDLKTSIDNLEKIPKNLIPSNEIGKLMESRNRML